MKNNGRTILFWAYFWQYGIIALGILPFIIIGGISAITDNYNYTLIVVSLLCMPSSLIVAGIYYIIGAKLEFAHIRCVLQSMRHEKMDPFSVEWTVSNKKEIRNTGIVMTVIGTIILTAFVILYIL